MSDIRYFEAGEWETGSLSFGDGERLLASLIEIEVLSDTRTVLHGDDWLSAEKSEHRALGWIAYRGLKGGVANYVFLPKGGAGHLAWFALSLVPG